jgi:hypothetical protein
MSWLGPPQVVVLFLLWVVPVAVSVWVVLDVTNYSEAAFERAGTNRTLWIVLAVVGVFICMMSIVVAIVWFAAYRNRVRQAAAGA